MKKSFRIIAAVMAALLLLCSCGETGETPLRSQKLDKTGYFAGVKALDYVDLTDISTIPITEQAIQDYINVVLESYPKDVPVYDRPLDDGETASIAYTGYIDGEEFEGGSAEDYRITVGETIFIDTFIRDCKGHMPGETFRITEAFPSYYPANEELQNKVADFDVTINYLIDTAPGDYTDEYIAENMQEEFGWTTCEDMRATIIQELAYNYVKDNSPISEIPETVLEAQKNNITAYYQYYADYYETELQDFIKTYMGYDNLDALLEDSTDYIEQNATQALLFQAIAEKCGFEKITKKDIRDYFKATTGSSDFTAARMEYGLPCLKQMTRDQVIFGLLSDRAVVQ